MDKPNKNIDDNNKYLSNFVNILGKSIVEHTFNIIGQMLSFNTITNSIDENKVKDVITRKNDVNKVSPINYNFKFTSLNNRIVRKKSNDNLNDFKFEQQNIYLKNRKKVINDYLITRRLNNDQYKSKNSKQIINTKEKNNTYNLFKKSKNYNEEKELDIADNDMRNISNTTYKSNNIELKDDFINSVKNNLNYKDSKKQFYNDSKEKENVSDSGHDNTYDKDSYKNIINNLKDSLWNDILENKNETIKYEITKDNFDIINIERYGNCLYCCISYFLYKIQDNHPKIRQEVYEYLNNHEDNYLTYFINDENIDESKEIIYNRIDKYIIDNNKLGEYGGDLELSILSDMLNANIYLFSEGYSGYNIYNVYEIEKKNILNKSFIYLLFVDDNHFDYLDININNTNYNNKEKFNEIINNLIEVNKVKLSELRVKNYPIT